MIGATRYHDISCGHRVVGHEGKCALLHGHNYRVHFTVEPVSCLDDLGRVVDFSVIKSTLCDWLESNWDHKFLLWESDTFLKLFLSYGDIGIVLVPFNPTAENMAQYLLYTVGVQLLPPTLILTKVVVEETRKCSAVAAIKRGEGHELESRYDQR